MTAHAKLSASSSKRWLSCPASVPLSEHIPRKTSVYAEEGTAAHALGEYCLKNNFKDPHECIGYTSKQLGEDFGDYVVDEDMAYYVKIYVDTIKNDWLTVFKGEDVEMNVETQVHLKHLETETSGPLFGTNDCAIIDPFNRLAVYDLKYGKGVEVLAEGNTQGLYYALGAWIAADRSCDEIEIVIIQPRLDDYNARVKRWVIDSETLEQYEQTLKDGIERVRQAYKVIHVKEPDYFKNLSADKQLKILGDLLNVSDEGCKFCPIMATCPKIFEDTMSSAMADFDPGSYEVTLPEVKELTSEQVLLVLNNAKKITDFVAAVEAYAQHEAEGGTKIPNYKLVHGRSNRVWKYDEAQTIEKLKKLKPKLKDRVVITTTKVISPAQYEKLAGKGVADSLITKPLGKLTLVPESDKRKAVVPAVDDFSEVTETGEDLDSSLFE